MRKFILNSIEINKWLVAIICIMTTISVSAQSKSSAELQVEKNRSMRSVGDFGGIYKMELLNTSSSPETFILKTKNLMTDCGNSHFKNNGANVPLNVSFLTPNIKSKIDNEITLRPGQSRKFTIKVSKTKETPTRRWNCLEVIAVAKSTGKPASMTILKSYIIDPEDTE